MKEAGLWGKLRIAKKNWRNIWAIFEKSIRAEEVRREFELLEESVNKFNRIREKIIQFVNLGKKDEVLTLMRSEAKLWRKD